MNLDITPEEFGIHPCPESGEGCHGWIYGAAHRLVAAGFEDDEIEAWIEAYLKRPSQPREIANTLSKVRAEADGKIAPRKGVGAKRPKDEAAITKLLEGGPISVEDFIASSPSPVSIDTSVVLKALFPGQKTILFTDQMSQGQRVWDEAILPEDVDRLGRTNTQGAWFLLNPVTGDYAEREGAKPSRRSEATISAYKHVLVESDNVNLGEWLAILRQLDLPIVCVTLSGNASAHAIVRVSADNRDEWVAAAKKIADLVVPLGADPNAITAVRLTRLPGVVRKDNGNEQRLIWFNPEAVPTEKCTVNKPEGDETGPKEDTGAPKEDKTSETPAKVVEKDDFSDIYYDGKAYFMRSADGIWRYEMAGMLHSALKVRGYADSAPKGRATQMDIAKGVIREHRRVDGAGPRLYSQYETWTEGGKRFLNTACVKLMPAAESAGAWGERFPRYAAILDNTFADPTYKEVFLAWFKRFYESAGAGDLALGQALALVGPVQCFKSFIIEQILRPAMGGYADLSSIVSGESNGFNSELYHSPLAVIDDSKASESEAQLNRYSSAIKKLAAHGRHKYHEKFVTPILVEWKGRVIIAANDDAVSIQSVPALDISNEDKLIVLAMRTWEDNPGPAALTDVVEELPHLLAWIREWTVPARYIDAGSRYGIRSVIAAEIRDKIEASARYAELQDTINAWWRRRPIEDRETAWEGTAVELHQDFNTIFDNSALTREWTVRNLGHRLRQLSNIPGSGVSIVQRRYGPLKVIKWRIEPPAKEILDAISDEPF
jgi:hypothetical protein